jgi:hypothetical protein
MSKQEAATPAPQEPAPMTREWCAAYPGAAAGIINRLARQVDATWPVATGYAEGKVHMAPSVAPQEPAGWRLVPLPFIQGVCALAHNYSFTAIPPDYYRGVEGDAFKDAYRRCGRELAKVRAMLTAAPQEPAEPVAVYAFDGERNGFTWLRKPNQWAPDGKPIYLYTQSVADAQDARRYRWLRDPANASHPNWHAIFTTGDVLDKLDAIIDAAMALDVTKRDPNGA